MANYDFVIPYDQRLEDWLRERGHPCPKAAPANRFPTKAEVVAAVARLPGLMAATNAETNEIYVERSDRLRNGYEVLVESLSWDRLGECETDSITMRGYLESELSLLGALASVCGQLVLYPDTGDPAVIVEPGADVGRLGVLLNEASSAVDSWDYFFANAYGAHAG